MTEVKYFRLIVTTEGICINPKKVQVIIDWELPTTVKDVQAFLRFAEFYRQFIAGLFRITKLLMEITKSNHVITRSSKRKVKYNLFQ